MKRLARDMMAAVPVLLLLPVWAARAQTGFACPNAGTIVVSGGQKYVWDGYEPDDPVICDGTHPDGRHIRRLYGWFDPDDIAPGGDRSVRLALQALFSGKKSEVTFRIITKEGVTDSYTWRRLGQEILKFGVRFADTTIYQSDEFFVLLRGSTPVGCGRRSKLWFDPTTGVFVKAKLVSMYGPGEPSGRGWTVHSVKTP